MSGKKYPKPKIIGKAMGKMPEITQTPTGMANATSSDKFIPAGHSQKKIKL